MTKPKPNSLRLSRAQEFSKRKSVPAREAVYLLDRMDAQLKVIRELYRLTSEPGKAIALGSMSPELKALVKSK